MTHQRFAIDQRTPEWHAKRKATVGGSDVAVLFGLNDYKTVPELWCDKATDVASHVDEEFNPHINRGVTFEPMVERLFGEKFPSFERDPESAMYFVDPEHHMHYSPDGIYKDKETGERVLAEFKVPSPYRVNAIKEDGADPKWVLQTQHGMHVAECDRAIIAILDVFSGTIITFDVTKSKEVIDAAKAACKLFFEDFVHKNEPPYAYEPPNVTQAKIRAAVKAQEMQAHGGEVVVNVVSGPKDGCFAEFNALKAEAKAIEEQLKEAKARVEGWFEANFDMGLGSAEVDGVKITRSQRKGRKSLDVKTMRAAMPDLPWEKYEHEGKGYAVMRVTSNSGEEK